MVFRKNVVVLLSGNYKIATEGHSKTVVYNHLRMYDVKDKNFLFYYKIITASYFKTVLNNRLRTRVLKNNFCSSEVYICRGQVPIDKRELLDG